MHPVSCTNPSCEYFGIRLVAHTDSMICLGCMRPLFPVPVDLGTIVSVKLGRVEIRRRGHV